MKRYIISTVVPGERPHLKFIGAQEQYVKENPNTEILWVPSAKIYADDQHNVKIETSEYLISNDFKLNNNIKISLLPINPEAVDPVMGLDRLNDKDNSVIYSSPKQRLKPIPSPKTEYPRFVMTPGASTVPLRAVTKRSIIAANDHVLGAIIVEIENGSLFHFRQVQADRDGSFIDLGYRYRDGSSEKVGLEALTPGDWHTGFTDPKVRATLIDLMKTMKPKYLFLHDFFDGISVNHHIQFKYLEKSLLGNLNDLTSELILNANELKSLSKLAEKVFIIKSNHDEFLDRWLNEAKYVSDNRNHVIGLELALAKARGEDPLEHGIRKYQDFDNVTFLKSTDSFTITSKNIECGQHGHRGPNGAQGSVASLEKSYGYITDGHSHAPEILRNHFRVGTSTYLQLSYNLGPSSWVQTACLTYSNGSRQLINIINGKYKAE